MKLTIESNNPITIYTGGRRANSNQPQQLKVDRCTIYAGKIKQALRHFTAIANHHNQLIGLTNHVSKAGTESAYFINTLQLCKDFKINERTSRRWRNSGRIPFIKLGRFVCFDRDEVVNALYRR